MKRFLFAVLSLMTALNLSAQSDASQYFDNKPFGWGTCSDAAGTHAILNGGYGTGNPKTITLKATGTATDGTNIENAVKQNDVIILDGSNGDFIIPTQIRFRNLKNKTIVGINNARLKTQFQLTDAIRAHLTEANLDGLSSTKQITNTLPNGTTLTCDERAFYTKKAMIEATGDMQMSFAKSGIFELNQTDENFIIRNITFEGPGSIDVDGVDLISQYGANYVWVDHCSFIDGMDGNLDSGKRTGTPMFVTYSWNKFEYTSKSFSHPYSNGTGWMNGTNHQYITYAFCWWSKGCGRRLPQVDDADIHLLNNYYDASGAVCMGIHDNVNALIEGVYTEPTVNKVFDLGTKGTTKYITTKCYFGESGSVLNNQKYPDNNVKITVPYEYKKIDLVSNVKKIIKSAQGGAGATLTNDQAMPVCEAGENTGGGGTTGGGDGADAGTYVSIDPTTVDGFSTLVFDDGAKLALTGNKDKAYTAGNAITLPDGTAEKGIKLSNGAANTFYCPEGKKAIKVEFYSYFNAQDKNQDFSKYPETGFRDCYWSKVDTQTFTYADMQLKSRDGAKPDYFATALPGVDKFEFKNAGEQLVFSMIVTYGEPDGIKGVAADEKTSTIIYNIYGQPAAANTKGIVIKNGKKFIVK